MIEEPLPPALDGYVYGDIVEYKGQRGVIYELYGNEPHTCTVKLMPITDRAYSPADPDWPLSECTWIGTWNGNDE